ncbi:MAG: hypothetical protein ACI3YC_02755 [Alloprevotella sp.]
MKKFMLLLCMGVFALNVAAQEPVKKADCTKCKVEKCDKKACTKDGKSCGDCTKKCDAKKSCSKAKACKDSKKCDKVAKKCCQKAAEKK